MTNKVSIDDNFRNVDINIKDASNTVINPAKEDGALKTMSDRFITILGPSGQSWDATTTNIVTLHHSHDFIHDGLRFIAHEYTSLANGNVKYYKILTGTKWVHFIPKISSNAEIVVAWLESPTITVNGSTLTNYNRNRTSANTALTTIYSGSTATADGTEIESVVISSGKSFGDLRSEEEIVLKPSTTYAMKITANAAVNYSINFDIYET